MLRHEDGTVSFSEEEFKTLGRLIEQARREDMMRDVASEFFCTACGKTGHDSDAHRDGREPAL